MRIVALLFALVAGASSGDAAQLRYFESSILCQTRHQAERLFSRFRQNIESGWMRYAIEHGRERAFKLTLREESPCSLEIAMSVYVEKVEQSAKLFKLWRVNGSITGNKLFRMYMITFPGAPPEFKRHEADPDTLPLSLKILLTRR